MSKSLSVMADRHGHGIRSAAGFSLIEMLIVVAIIGTLASLIVPGIQKMQTSAKAASTTSRLKSAAAAVSAYGAENGGAIPLLYGKAGFKSPFWTDEIAPYMATTTKARVDGRDFRVSLQSDLLKNSQHHEMSDFGANAEVFLTPSASYGTPEPRRPGSIPNPSKTVMLVTASEGSKTPIKGSWYLDTWEYVNGNKNANMPSDHGSGKIIAVFVDGHVESIAKADFESNKRSLLLVDPAFHPPPYGTPR